MLGTHSQLNLRRHHHNQLYYWIHTKHTCQAAGPHWLADVIAVFRQLKLCMHVIAYSKLLPTILASTQRLTLHFCTLPSVPSIYTEESSAYTGDIPPLETHWVELTEDTRDNVYCHGYNY